MTTIEVTIDGSKYSVQRETFDLRTAYDDFLNLLFMSGADVNEMADLLAEQAIKKNHTTDEDQPVSNPCNI